MPPDDPDAGRLAGGFIRVDRPSRTSDSQPPGVGPVRGAMRVQPGSTVRLAALCLALVSLRSCPWSNALRFRGGQSIRETVFLEATQMTTIDHRSQPASEGGRQIRDPRDAYPRPPFPTQQQELPGRDSLLMPKPDHGEQSYVGHGLLAGLATIVTGADSGIGKAVAIAFAREGADVVISYLDSHDDARQTIDLVEAEGRRAIVVPGDLQDEQHCRRIVEQTRDELGLVDVLVNNAAYQQRFDSVEDVSTEEWERTLRTNLTATFWTSREAVKVMEPGASIINVSSIQASDPSPNLLAYATTKGGEAR